MIRLPKWNDMSRRTRRLVAGVTALLIAVGATLAVMWARELKQPRGQARQGSTSTSSMEGTAGMSGIGAGGAVQLTAAQIRTFGVTFGTVEQRILQAEVRTVGTVQFDETRTAQITPKIGGFLERLYVNFTGQPVQRGQPLVEIFSPDLLAAEQELLLAARLDRTMGESAVPGVAGPRGSLLASARARLRLWDVSEAQIDAVLRTGTVRRTLTLYAPVSGVVVEKNVLQGQAVQPGQALYKIADLSRVWIEAEVREADAGAVKPGALANIQFAAFPGVSFTGRVDYVNPTLQLEARTARARIQISNPRGLIKPGMYATVRLAVPLRSALSVPVSALVRTGERTLVFVDMGSAGIAPRQVATGSIAGEFAEIISGLEPGQRVVTSAQFLIDSESNLGEVMKRMMGQIGAQDVGRVGAMKDMPGTNLPQSTNGNVGEKGADMRGMPGMQMPPKQR